MTRKQAISKAKKAAKSQPGHSYYVVDDFDGIDVLTHSDYTFELNRWHSYGDRLMAIISWWPAAGEYKAGYEIENYSQGDLVEG